MWKENKNVFLARERFYREEYLFLHRKREKEKEDLKFVCLLRELKKRWTKEEKINGADLGSFNIFQTSLYPKSPYVDFAYSTFDILIIHYLIITLNFKHP